MDEVETVWDGGNSEFPQIHKKINKPKKNA
jgi:hypothetical protein